MARLKVEIDGRAVRLDRSQVRAAVAGALGVAVSAVRVYVEPDADGVAGLAKRLEVLALQVGRAADGVLAKALRQSAQAVVAGHDDEDLAGQVTLLDLGLSLHEIDALFREELGVGLPSAG